MTDKKRLTVGILGGMGPMATVDLFRKILEATPATCDEEHLNIQVDCNPMPGARPEFLGERAARLERMGVDLIAMPCNQAHIYYDIVQGAVGIPVIHMIRETARTAATLSQKPDRVGVLAYPPTIEAGIYQRALQEVGIAPNAPDEQGLTALRDLIHAVKAGAVPEPVRRAAVAVGEALVARGAQALVLGCTELPLALSQADFAVPTVDATRVLAEAVVRMALSQ